MICSDNTDFAFAKPSGECILPNVGDVLDFSKTHRSRKLATVWGTWKQKLESFVGVSIVKLFLVLAFAGVPVLPLGGHLAFPLLAGLR